MLRRSLLTSNVATHTGGGIQSELNAPLNSSTCPPPPPNWPVWQGDCYTDYTQGVTVTPFPIIFAGPASYITETILDLNCAASAGDGAGVHMPPNAHPLAYALPAPAGHFINSATRCMNPPPPEAKLCDDEFNGRMLYTFPVGGTDDGGAATPYPFLCAPIESRLSRWVEQHRASRASSQLPRHEPLCVFSGAGGFTGANASSDGRDQTSFTCSGVCPSDHFCPPGTVSPTPCPAGTRAFPGARSKGDCIPCPLGHYCGNSTAEPTKCPPGTIGNSTSFSTPVCGGKCPVGHWCGAGCTDPIACPPGTFTEVTGATNESWCRPCKAGHWCQSGRPFACGENTYANGSMRADLSACVPCPANSSTNGNIASTSLRDCGCSPGFYRKHPNSTEDCTPCPSQGFDCSEPGGDTTTIVVLSEYWRPTRTALQSRLCPTGGSCHGGMTVSAAYNHDANVGCVNGTRGPYCQHCADDDQYFDKRGGRCRACLEGFEMVGSMLGLVLIIAIPLLIAHFRRRKRVQPPPPPPTNPAALAQTVRQEPLPGPWPPPRGDWRRRLPWNRDFAHRTNLREGTNAVIGTFAKMHFMLECACAVGAPLARAFPRIFRMWRRLNEAARAISLTAKLKRCIIFYQIAAQIGPVYHVRYPPGYVSITTRFFEPARLQLFGWVPGLHLSCLGMGRIESQLWLFIILPIGVVAVALISGRALNGSALSAAPFVMWVLFLVYPAVSSLGFQALAECDCFDTLERDNDLCFLPADTNVECSWRGDIGVWAGSSLRAVAWLAVLLYAGGVPLLYGALLFHCRRALVAGQSTRLSTTLAFLHESYRPEICWWMLVDVAHAIMLTGFLALVDPGHPVQLELALLVATGFQLLTSWARPYTLPGNNFVAMLTSAALVVLLLASLGVQTAAATGESRDTLLLSITLLGGTFVVFAFTLLILLCNLAVGSRRLRWARDDSIVEVPALRPGEAHVLIVCDWLTGGELACTVRDGLEALLPGLRCRLVTDHQSDGDDGVAPLGVVLVLTGFPPAAAGGPAGESAAFDPDAHNVHLQWLTRGHARCVRALRRARDEEQPVVALLETRAASGGVTLARHRHACPADLLPLLEAPVAWLPAPDGHVALREVSLRLLTQRLSATWKLAQRDGDVMRAPHEALELRLPPPPPPKITHLCFSAADPLAREVVALLQGEVARWQPGHGGRLRTRELAGDEHDDARSAARWLVCGHLAAALASGGCPPPLVVVVASADGTPLPPLDAISRAAPAVLPFSLSHSAASDATHRRITRLS